MTDPAPQDQQPARQTAAEDARARHRRMWRLAGPIIASNLSIPLLGAVDTAVIGHLDQVYYLGAIAVGALFFSFLYWGFGFLRMSTTAFVAQAIGGADKAEAVAVLARAATLALGLGAGIVLLQTPIAALGFGLIDASGEVEAAARTYFDIRVWGAPAALLNLVAMGWLFGLSRAGTALAIQVAMNGLNIVLDLVFVIGLGWAVDGVAAATLISEYAGATLGLVLVAWQMRRRGLWPALTALFGAGLRQSLGGPAIGRMLRVNRDIFLRTLCLILAFAVFTAWGARLGDLTLAANAVLLNFQTFLSYGLDGYAQAAETLVGGAVGARDRHALRRMVATTSQWALASAVLYSLVYGVAGEGLINLLTGLDAVRAAALEYLPWVIASPLISVWCYQLDGIFIGATRAAQMRNAMLVSFAVFLATLVIAVPRLGNHGLWLALMTFMAVRALTLAAGYRRLEAAVAEPARARVRL